MPKTKTEKHPVFQGEFIVRCPFCDAAVTVKGVSKAEEWSKAHMKMAHSTERGGK